MTEQDKNWIDGSSYEGLLARWRNAPIGDPIFQGDTGKYYGTVMAQKKQQVGAGAAVAASKRIGWDG